MPDVPDPGPETVTGLLREWRQGDREALDRLMPIVYDELHRLAGRLMRSERHDHTLQATALVHEAYARLARGGASPLDRVHFLSLSARVMRRILVDHARQRRRAKRGGGDVRVTFVELEAVMPGSTERLLEIDQALEMSLFGGLSNAEIATALQVSVPTVERDLRMARAWLRSELGHGL
jgi:RNA polymerase sigma factor (TIGR02999 family)